MKLYEPVVVCDLDGTLCDHSARVDLAQANDWDAFHARCHEDKPNRDVVTALSLIYHSKLEADIYALTGRNERYRKKTLDWLSEHAPFFTEVLMRPDNNYESDHVLKLRMLEEKLGGKEKVLERVAFVLEDRDKVIEAFRNYGLSTWQVRLGLY